MDIVTHITRMLKEGEEILKNEELLRKEAVRIQAEKDKEYNKEYLKTTSKEWKMRIDQTHYNGSTSPTWWYIPNKECSGFMKECYARWFWCDTGWFHDVWDKWFDMHCPGMMTVCISKANRKGYFPVRYRYEESFYDSGSHMSWNLCHYVSNSSNLYYTGWVGSPQGIREFIYDNMGYTPKKYPKSKEFVLWFKIEPIQPTRY